MFMIRNVLLWKFFVSLCDVSLKGAYLTLSAYLFSYTYLLHFLCSFCCFALNIDLILRFAENTEAVLLAVLLGTTFYGLFLN